MDYLTVSKAGIASPLVLSKIVGTQLLKEGNPVSC